MTRDQLEHVIRAASAISEDEEIIIIGSQSILGAYPDAPATLLVSMEADVFPRKHPDRADLIEGSIGEGSMFHDTFGYYAQGVGPETATLPAGWESRLIAIRNENTHGATGLALDPHDLAIAKYVAAREKDHAFLTEAARAGLVNARTLRDRLRMTDVDPATRERVGRAIEAHFGKPPAVV
jgi:hypothetical protein